MGKELIKSSMLALRQACSISFCVTWDSGLMLPSRRLKRIVPAYSVYEEVEKARIRNARENIMYRLLRYQGNLLAILLNIQIRDDLVIKLGEG
jgi:hypothetical protein